MGSSIKKNLPTSLRFQLMAVIASAIMGLCFVGCGDSEGGGSAEFYSLKGYNGVETDAAGQSYSEDNPYPLYAEFPWFVHFTFQVSDEDGNRVTDLGVKDFNISEDGAALSLNETEMQLHQRDDLPSGYTFALDTVLILDNTPSQTGNLDTIKEAAQAMIEGLQDDQQQRIAIVAFDKDGDPFVKLGFTNDITALMKCLTAGEAAPESSLQQSSGTTNLYEAVIEALKLWNEDPRPDDKSYRFGNLVVVTDGWDTTGIYDLNDALHARGQKRVYTVAVASGNISGTNKDELETLGNAGYFSVAEPNRDGDKGFDDDENLSETLKEIRKRIQNHADSFYWLKYKSPSINSSDDQHQVRLGIRDNNNENADAFIYGSFSSAAFVSGTGGVFLNASAADPDGINGSDSDDPDVIELSFDPYRSDNPTFELHATTIREDKSKPNYTWETSEDEKEDADKIIRLKRNEDDSSKVEIVPRRFGSAQVTVIDEANGGLSKTVDVLVAKAGINLTSESAPDGLSGIDSKEPDTIQLVFDPIDEMEDETCEITASTFGENSRKPDYKWESSDPGVVTVEPDDSDSTKAVITATGFGGTRITVTDKANEQTISIFVHVAKTGQFRFMHKSIEPVYPWYVNGMFHVKDIKDLYDREATILSLEDGDFIITETDEQTGEETAITDDTERHIWKHDAMPLDYTYTFKTVLLLDRTPSNAENLEEIKNAAQKMVEKAFSGSIRGDDGSYQQEIGVWAFADSVEEVIPFSKNKEAIKSAIRGIQKPSSQTSTDLYGAVIEGLSFYEENFQVSENNEIVEGAVIVVTDGRDTYYGQNDFEDALNARNSEDKQVITVGVGKEVADDEEVSTNLEELGNLDYFLVPNPGEIINEEESGEEEETVKTTLLADTFLSAQQRLENYADSFYWLEYKSATPGTDDPTSHTLTIEIRNNDYTDTGSTFERSFSKADFFSGLPGVYVNSTVEDPGGIETGEELSFCAFESADGFVPFSEANEVVDLSAITMVNDPDSYVAPSYSWTIADSDIVIVEPNPDDSSMASLQLSPDNAATGTATLRVADTANSSLAPAVINVDVQIIDNLIAYYPFNGNANDVSGNGYNGVLNGPSLTTDRFGNAKSAYNFDRNRDDYIAIENLHYGTDPDAFMDSIGQISVCAWIKTSGTPDLSRIISFDSEYWALRMDSKGAIKWITETGVVISSDTNYDDNKWHFVCAIYDSVNSIKALYIDGMLAGDRISVTGAFGTGITRYGFIGEGSEAIEFNGKTNSDSFNGAIDDVMIFDRALEESQINALYNYSSWVE